MFTYNYHTHTARCGHAIGKDEEYVKKAIKAGYTTLGFSDHAPYKGRPARFSRMDWEELDDYINSLTELKVRYKDKTDIHIGLETEYFPELLDEKKELHDKVEYLILGQHVSDPDGSVNYFATNTDEQIMLYADLICKGLDTGLFTYLAHPDMFMSHQSSFSDACQKAAHIIAAKCQETGTPMEINARGVMKGKHSFEEGQFYSYPFKLFWKIVSQYDVKVVVGIDAHAPADLLEIKHVEKALEELQEFNLNIITEPFI